MKDASLKEILPTIPWLRALHFLLSATDGKHIAHCLDLDLVSVGATRAESVRKLDDLVKAQIELSLNTGTLVNLATKAPNSFWQEYFAARAIDLEPKSIRIRVPDIVPIEPSESEIGILARERGERAA